MATENLGLPTISGSSQQGSFPTAFNGAMNTVDGAYGALKDYYNGRLGALGRTVRMQMGQIANGGSLTLQNVQQGIVFVYRGSASSAIFAANQWNDTIETFVSSSNLSASVDHTAKTMTVTNSYSAYVNYLAIIRNADETYPVSDLP